MCGFVAISSDNSSDFSEVLRKATDTQAHRGPDASGLFVSDLRDCYLGHTRLSILDTSMAGVQPLEDISGRFVISYNGEVYNYRELKKELEIKYGHIPWRSTSDTEVVVEGFAREGDSFLSKLNGTFAFSIYDKVEKNQFILRDPLGVKPLFVHHSQNAWLFASELKALKPLVSKPFTLREEAIQEILAFMYIPEPNTLYREVKKVTPGKLLILNHGKLIQERELDFVELKSTPIPSDENELAISFRETFCNAVERQLISDVPLGMMLSGGLDSSAVAYAADLRGVKIQEAYTISFSQKALSKEHQSDDLKYANLVARNLGLNLNIIPAELNFADLIPDLVGFLEDGITDPAALNTYLICKQARESGIKVMLTGQGADEYLAGYRRYLGERLIAKMPNTFRGALGSIHPLIGSQFKGKLNSIARRVKKISKAASLAEEDRILSLFTWETPSKISSLLNGFENNSIFYENQFKEFYKSQKEELGDNLLAMARLDQKYDLTSLNLTYCDRMSMAAGVEARVPILDFQLVSLMNEIPMSMKLKGGTAKYIMKKAFDGIIPSEIIYREKAGFFSPIRTWIDEEGEFVMNSFESLISGKISYFNSDAMKTLVNTHREKRIDNSNILYSLIVLQNLLEKEGLV